jgi:hypothetical protein
LEGSTTSKEVEEEGKEVEEEEEEEEEEDDTAGVGSMAAASPDSKEDVVRNFCAIVSELFSIHLANSSQVLATLLSLTYNSG